MTEEEIRRDERERCAKLMIEEMDRTPGAGMRTGLAFAANILRRGRLLSGREQLSNLAAAIDDKPVPHPAPKVAI